MTRNFLTFSVFLIILPANKCLSTSPYLLIVFDEAFLRPGCKLFLPSFGLSPTVHHLFGLMAIAKIFWAIVSIPLVNPPPVRRLYLRVLCELHYLLTRKAVLLLLWLLRGLFVCPSRDFGNFLTVIIHRYCYLIRTYAFCSPKVLAAQSLRLYLSVFHSPTFM